MGQHVTVAFRFEDGIVTASRQPLDSLPSLIHDCRVLHGDRDYVAEWLGRGKPARLVPDTHGIVVVDYARRHILSVQNRVVFGHASVDSVILELGKLVGGAQAEHREDSGGRQLERWQALLAEERISLELVNCRSERVSQTRPLETPTSAGLLAEAEQLWNARRSDDDLTFWRFSIKLLPLRSTDFRCRNQSGLAEMLEQLRSSGFRLDAPEAYRWREAIKGETGLTGWTC